MDSDGEVFGNIWEMLLSRNPRITRQAFEGLSGEEQISVRDHLERMISESGWQPEQRESARAALEAISESAR